MRDVVLVVFARAPEFGKVKTRLARDLGDGAALCVYRQLLGHTGRLAAAWPDPVLLAATGDVRAFAGTGLSSHFVTRQSDGNLGERLAEALQTGLQLGRAAVVIGTDCPSLRLHHLRALLDGLTHADCSLGPATDGGFWGCAVASKAAAATLAQPDLPWSSTTTLLAVRSALLRVGIASRLGPLLSDVDTVDDLRAAIAAGHLDGDFRGERAPTHHF